MQPLVFFGSAPFSTTVLQKLLDSQVNLVATITSPDKPAGRHLKLTPNPVKVLAQKHSIPVYTDIKQFLPVTLPDETVALVAAYGRSLGPKTLSKFNNQIYNIHPSLLPKYRGSSPLQNQILDNASTGVTIIQIDELEDHGPIIAQQKDELQTTDTKETLGNRLFSLGTDLFLSQDLKNLKPIPQDEAQATYTKQLTRTDGFIEFSEFKVKLANNDQQLATKFRAYHPWPGIWTTTPEGKRLKLVSLNPSLIQQEGEKPQSSLLFPLK